MIHGVKYHHGLLLVADLEAQIHNNEGVFYEGVYLTNLCCYIMKEITIEIIFKMESIGMNTWLKMGALDKLHTNCC